MASEIQTLAKEQFTSYENHYGVDIDFDDINKEYVASVWSSKEQRNIEISDRYLTTVKLYLNDILVNNYYESLLAIKEHFNHTANFNDASDNLDSLRVSITKKVNERLEDI